MAIRIGSNNISALSAERHLGEAGTRLSKTFERLSSGSRINRAVDDAAGLAIAEALDVKGRVLSRGVKNINDGISLLSIADNALGLLSDIATRMVELAEQAANGSYSNTQRKALDNEAQQLAKEYYRISRETQFNGLRIFDGSLQGLSIQTDFGTDGAIRSSLGGKLGDGTLQTNVNYSTGTGPGFQGMATGDLNGDGNLDIVTPNSGSGTISALLGNGDGSFRSPANFSVSGTSPYSVALADINGDGSLDAVSANNGSNYVSVLIGNGDGTFRAALTYGTNGTWAASNPRDVALSDLNGDGAVDVVTANTGGPGGTTILLGNGDGSFRSATYLGTGGAMVSAKCADVNGDGKADILLGTNGQVFYTLLGNGDGTFKTAVGFNTLDSGPSVLTAGDINGDGRVDVLVANRAGVRVDILLGNGDGTFSLKSRMTLSADAEGTRQVLLGDLNGDSAVDMVAVGDFSPAKVLIGNGDGTFSAYTTFGSTSLFNCAAVLADFNGDAVLDVGTADFNASRVGVLLGNTRDGIAPILSFSLATRADALQALMPLKRAADNLVIQRGVVGAFQSRMETAIRTTSAAAEHYTAAQGRIRDADVAQEAADLTRLQIVQQAATAVLAQANQSPALALSLLGR